VVSDSDSDEADVADETSDSEYEEDQSNGPVGGSSWPAVAATIGKLRPIR
jgi:hypothetical protein